MRVVIDFADTLVFGAVVFSSIVITTKGQAPLDHTYHGLTVYGEIDPEKLDVVFAQLAQVLSQAQGVQPPASSSNATFLVEKLKKLGIPLGKRADCKIYYGIKPGRKAFLVDQVIHDRLIAEDPRSAEVLKPFLRGRDIERYFIRPTEMWLIYTYHGIDISQYPAIKAYLEPYKADLDGRATKQAWYELQQPQKAYQSGFEGLKIVYPDITPRADFAFDVSGAYPDTTAFCIPTQATYLTAILNSKLLDFVLKHLSPIIRGGSYRYKREYVQLLPIVDPSIEDQARLAALVDQLQALCGQGPQAEALEREVDAIVYRTYGLSEEEIVEIERWHAERQAQLGAGRRGQRIIVDETIEEAEA